MNDSFELYYNNGGHGGPYQEIIHATQQAKRLIAGDTSRSLTCVEVRPVTSKAIGGFKYSNKESIYIDKDFKSFY